MAAESASLSNANALPLRRKRSEIASGLPVSARWSPSTPFSAATIASRDGDGSTWPEQRTEAAEYGVDAPAHQPGHAVHAAIDQSRDPARAARGRRFAEAGGAAEIVMHRLDEVGEAAGRVDGEATGAAQVGKVVAVLRRHHRSMPRRAAISLPMALRIAASKLRAASGINSPSSRAMCAA